VESDSDQGFSYPLKRLLMPRCIHTFSRSFYPLSATQCSRYKFISTHTLKPHDLSVASNPVHHYFEPHIIVDNNLFLLSAK